MLKNFMLKDFLKHNKLVLVVSAIAVVVAVSMMATGPPTAQNIQPVTIVGQDPNLVVRQVVIVKGYTPLSLQTAVNQMLRDSNFVNVRLTYESLPYWDVVMISHDVQVVE